MLTVNWQGNVIDVERLVFRNDLLAPWRSLLAGWAAEFHLAVADETAPVRQGDFWLGCQPERGWGNHRDAVAWVGGLTLPVAIAQLKTAVTQHRLDESLIKQDVDHGFEDIDSAAWSESPEQPQCSRLSNYSLCGES